MIKKGSAIIVSIIAVVGLLIILLSAVLGGLLGGIIAIVGLVLDILLLFFFVPFVTGKQIKLIESAKIILILTVIKLLIALAIILVFGASISNILMAI